MTEKIRYLVLVVVGTALTLSIANAGWRVFLAVVSQVGAKGRGRSSVIFDKGRVLYSYGGNVLMFPVDFHPHLIVRVPDHRCWASEMPHWSHRIRSEVVEDLKQSLASEQIDVAESCRAPEGAAPLVPQQARNRDKLPD